MAIRAGAKELKYPLPSMYQIGAQQSAAAASSGGSASASAYSTNRNFAANKMRVQADLANSAADRQFRAMSQLEGQNFRAQQEFYDREHSKGAQLEGQRFSAEQQQQRFDQQRESQWQDQYFQAERDRQQQGFTTERDKALFEQEQVAFEAKRDAGIQDAIQAGKLELSPEAQMRLQKIEDGRAHAQDLDPAQRAEFEQRAAEQEREILRSAKPPRSTATGRATKSTTYFDPATGAFADQMGPGRVPGTVSEKGEFQPIVDNSKQDKERQQQQSEMQEGLDTEATKIMGEDVAVGQSPMDYDSAYEEALRRRRMTGRPTPEQAPADPTGPTLGMGDSVEQRSGGSPAHQPPAGAGQQAAVPLGGGQPPAWQGAPPPLDQMSTPMSAQERDALPPGSYYLTPNGEMKRRK